MIIKLFPKKDYSRLIYRRSNPESSSEDLDLRSKRQCDQIKKKANSEATPLYKEALEVVTLRENNQIDPNTFDEFAELALKRKYKNSEPLLHLAISLKKQKFPEKAKGAFQFVRAIQGNLQQQQAAAKELTKLSQSAPGAISKYRYLEILRKIRDPENPASKIQDKSTLGMFSEIANTREQIENLQGKLAHHHWQPQEVPQTLRQEIKTKEQNLQASIQESNELIIKKDLSTTEKKRLKELDQQIPKLLREIDSPLQQQKDIFTLNLQRKRELDKWSQKIGFDFNDQNLNYTSQSGDPITIEDVYFTTGVNTPQIKYLDHAGNNNDTNAAIFLQNCQANHIYRQIDSLSSLNKILGFPLGRKALSIGDNFANNSSTPDIQVIAVSDTEIKLNSQITLREAGKHPAPNDSEIKKDTLTLGEFAKLIKTQKYQRVITADETADIISANHQFQQEQIQEATQILSENQQDIFNAIHQDFGAFKPPALDQSQDIFYINEHPKQLRRAKITRKKDGTKEYYQITHIPPETLDLQALNAAKIPRRLLNISIDQTPNRTTQNLTPWTLIKWANNGDIVNFDPNDLPQQPPNNSTNTPPAENNNNSTVPPAVAVSKTQSEIDKIKKSVDDEALAYKDSYIEGALDKSEQSYLSQLWATTSFYSPADFWQLIKDIKEYWDRDFDRKQNERVGKLGERMPFYTADFRAKRQSAETQAVNQYKEALSELEHWEIEAVIKSTSNPDEMKAAFTTLAEKGWLRWDDVEMWSSLNKFASSSNQIPIPENGNPYTMVGGTPGSPKTGFDFLKRAIDTIWDNGTYNEWVNKNNSGFGSGKDSYANEVDDLGSAEKGYRRELSGMLRDHKRGRWVDPHRYEEYISHAIEQGKSSVEVKIFYIIQGIAVKSPSGRSILNFERLRALNAKHLGHFPIIDFFTEALSRYNEENGKPAKSKSTKVTALDIQAWSELITKDSTTDGTYPGKETTKFLWNYVLTSNRLTDRLGKMMRGAGSKIDHDDTQAFAPFLDATPLINFTQSSSGNHKATSLLGYINIYAGLSQGLKTASKTNDINKLTKVMNNFFIYDSIMRGRYDRTSSTYQRWPAEEYFHKKYGYLERPAAQITEEFFTVMREVINNYELKYSGNSKAMGLIKQLRDTFELGISNAKCDAKKPDEVTKSINNFNSLLTKVKELDGGELIMQTMNKSRQHGNLTGIFEYDEDREYRKSNGIKPPADFIRNDGSESLDSTRHAIDPNYREKHEQREAEFRASQGS